MYTNIIVILKWITKYWYPNIPREQAYDVIHKWISQVHKWIHCNGIVYSIKRIKFIRLIVTRYLCGQPLMVNDMIIGVDKSGFPICIGYMKPYIDSKSPQELRFILTLLGISRSFWYPAPADYSSIWQPYTGSKVTIDPTFISLFVKDFCGHFDMLTERPSFTKAFLSLKAGPVGGPAILSATVSAAKLTGVNLWAMAYIAGDKFMEGVKTLKLAVSLTANHKLGFGVKAEHLAGHVELMNRRFLHVFDPELKHRLVACFDYISQLVLDPFSRWCFKTLERNFPRDRTFTQDPVIKDKANDQKYHSFDLSSATDRFPMFVQVQLLSEVAGPAFAYAWKGLMISEPFLADVGGLTSDIKHPLYTRPTMFKYAVGQPMGARSSWAFFTISHHMVVQYSAYQCGKYPFKDYILLGDDIVIYQDDVALKYQELLKSLGVEISSSKTHVSIDTYEFAKRWFHNGVEISPVPLAGILNNLSNPKLLYSQILDLIYKGRGPRLIIQSDHLVLDLLKSLIQVKPKLSDQELIEKKIWNFFPCFQHENAKKLWSRTQIKYLARLLRELRVVAWSLKEFNEQSLREFMAQATVSNDYILPSDPVILLQEWKRAGSGVVNGMAMLVLKQLNAFHKGFMSNFDKLVESSFLSEVDSQAIIAHHPLTYAVYNSVKNYSDMNKSLGYTMDLNKQLETITLIDLDKLILKDRTAVNLVFTYSTFGRKLYYQLSQDPNLIIAKARSMQFGRSLFDNQLAFEKSFPNLKVREG